MSTSATPWYAVSGTLECPQCRNLLDRPGSTLEKLSRLHSTLDGFALYSFSCPQPDCGWISGEILVQIGLQPGPAEAPAASAPQAAIILPSKEEVRVLTAREEPQKFPHLVVAEPKPVTLEELHAYVIENSPNELRLADGKVLRRKMEKREEPGLAQGEVVGVVRLIYSEDNSSRGGFNFYQGEQTFFTSNGLPDMPKAMQAVRASISGDLQLLNEHPHRLVPKPVFNRQGSRLRGMCMCDEPSHGHPVPCGDTTGQCGCPGVMHRISSPGRMTAPASMLTAPDGSRVPSLQERLEANSGF